MEIKKAVRHSVNLIMSISGVSGSGKTYSALLLAAGLAGDGKVGFLDTENGRGSMYADSPGIVRALPNGYETIEMPAPFSPGRYIEAIDAFEGAGCRVLVIDSGSHEWEGVGSCSEMAEEDKNRWNRAKRQHKKFVLRLLNSSMHIIVCLRAREKSKIIDKKDSPDGKEHTIPLGIQPVAEKGFVFEMMLSWMVDEVTHFARPIKLPEQFAAIFAQPKLLSKTDGESIREWNSGAPAMDPVEKLKRQARAAADEGMDRYGGFYKALQPGAKKILADTTHAENKLIAEDADFAQASGSLEEVHGDRFFRALGTTGYGAVVEIPRDKRQSVLTEIAKQLEVAA